MARHQFPAGAHPRAQRRAHPFESVLWRMAAIGLALVLLVPALRAQTALGWPPLWLVGMPLSAWWALRGFPLRVPRAMHVPIRRRGPQARRRPGL